MEFKLSKPLSEVLQPLVDKVPKFEALRSLRIWVYDNFPCGSLSVASVASLGKWGQNKFIDGWSLGTGDEGCPLCAEVRLNCYECSLEKVGKMCIGNPDSDYHIARHGGDKQPLIHALELASVHALVDELRQKCEATVREASK